MGNLQLSLHSLRDELLAATLDFTRSHHSLILRAGQFLTESEFPASLDIAVVRFECTLQLARLCFLTSNSREGLDAVSAAARLAQANHDLPRSRQMLTLLGALQGESGNLGAALESYTTALNVCEYIDSAKDWALVWLNVSNTLITNSHLEHLTVRVLDLTLSHASQIHDPELRCQVESSANTNLTVAALREGKYGLGLKAGRRALRLCSQLPGSPWTTHTSAVLLASYGKLALRLRDIARAEECISTAKAIHAEAVTPKSALLIESLCGLFDVYTGKADQGIDRLERCLATSKATMPVFQGTFFRSLIEAHEIAGRLDEADRFREGLAAFCGKSINEDALFHHRRHMEAIAAGPWGSHLGSSNTGLLTTFDRPRPVHLRGQFATQTQVLENLAVAAALHDDASGEHPFRVARLAELVARESGFPQTFCAQISVAARLHDIGKAGVPPEVLKKTSPLSATERELVQRHTIVGADLLTSISNNGLKMAADIALYHHESWDGSGYPTGRAGPEIPLAARITSVAETFDALTHDRSYRPRMSVTRALELIGERAGRNFEPTLVQNLQRVVHRLLETTEDLDALLAADASEGSSFLRAKREMSRRIRDSEEIN